MCITPKHFHLCGEEHDCKGKCKIPGFYSISSVIKKMDIYNKKSHQISYEVYDTQTRQNELPCKIKIPPNRISSNGIHKCYKDNEKEVKHKCGFECQQCGHFCGLDHNHQELLHICTHGNIKNSRV